MKLFNKLSVVALVAVAMISCKDNANNANNAVPAQQQAPAQQVSAPAQQASAQQQPTAQAAAQNVQLPEPINAFLKQYFPNATVAFVETDSGYGSVEYDVTLSDGTEIDFDHANQWDNIDGHMNPVPAALVPPAIASYVKTNCQGAAITKLDRERAGYDVELANGMELRFDANGRFVGYDD